jgi:succinoglycan biosynthesis transport protein ExoP
MELRDLLAIAWKRRGVVLGVLVVSVLLAAGLASMKDPRYESTATVALTPNVARGEGLIASDNLSALLGTYAETAKSTLNLRRAEQRLGRPLPASIDTSTEAGTGILRITATADTPEDAAQAADATATAFQQSIRDNQLLVATIVDPASINRQPIQPRPPLIITIAALLGLFGGFLLAFLLETLRRRIETATDLAEYTSAPVVGRLPRQRTLARNETALVWGQQNAVPVQESYRALRTNLQFLRQDMRGVLEITSPEPGQGKSTVVANLGVAFAQIGVQTVILDADLRRPRQHEIFGLDNTTGLSSLMAMGGEVGLKPTGHDNLWVLTSGPIPPDPTEMLHIRFATVMQELREMDVLVLVDTPPILPVSDARLIASHTDGVLMLITAGTQKPSSLQAALERLRIVEASLLGLIINKAGQEAESQGGYYHYEPVSAGIEEPRLEPH